MDPYYGGYGAGGYGYGASGYGPSSFPGAGMGMPAMDPYGDTFAPWMYRPSRLTANPDFGNFRYRKGYTAEVTMDDGETVVLAADARTKTYRTHFSPLNRYSYSWLDRLLRFLWIDRLLGLHIDSVKKIRTKSFIFVTAHLLPN